MDSSSIFAIKLFYIDESQKNGNIEIALMVTDKYNRSVPGNIFEAVYHDRSSGKSYYETRPLAHLSGYDTVTICNSSLPVKIPCPQKQRSKKAGTRRRV